LMALKTGEVDMALYPSLPSLKELQKEYSTLVENPSHLTIKNVPFLFLGQKSQAKLFIKL
jgi:hypothetical protein